MTEREEAMINEAFTMGRVYSRMGEKESPHEIHEKLIENCERIGGAVSSGAAKVIPVSVQLQIAKLEGERDAYEFCAEHGYSNDAEWWQELADEAENKITELKGKQV